MRSLHMRILYCDKIFVNLSCVEYGTNMSYHSGKNVECPHCQSVRASRWKADKYLRDARRAHGIILENTVNLKEANKDRLYSLTRHWGGIQKKNWRGKTYTDRRGGAEMLTKIAMRLLNKQRVKEQRSNL